MVAWTEAVAKAERLESGNVEAVRSHCLSQARVWQEIPYWAFHAYGRYRSSVRLRNAFMHGYWDIVGDSKDWRCALVVDLATGEIQFGEHPVYNDQLLGLFKDNSHPDAISIITDLMNTVLIPADQCTNFRTEEEFLASKLRMHPEPPRPFVRS